MVVVIVMNIAYTAFISIASIGYVQKNRFNIWINSI
jgi:hypothetical protein